MTPQRCLTIIMLVFVLAIQPVAAQEESRDWLKQLVAAKDDTNKLRLLYNLSYHYRFQDPDSTLFYMHEAVDLAVKLKSQQGIVDAKASLGHIYWKRGEFDKAIQIHKEALELAQAIQNKKAIMEITTAIGQDYADKADFTTALTYFQKTMELCKAENKKSEQAGIYLLFAWVYNNQGNFPEMDKANFQALKIYEELGDKYGAAVCNSNIAAAYMSLDKPDTALVYYKKSQASFKKAKDMNNYAGIYIDIANILFKQGDTIQAMANLNQAMDYGRQFNDEVMLGNSYFSMAGYNFEHNRFARAEGLYRQAVEKYLAANDKHDRIKVYNQLALCYIRLDKPALARTALDSSKHLLNGVESLSYQAKFYNGLQLYDSLTGNWHNAYKNYYKYIEIRDSIYNVDNSKKELQHKIQYDYDKKEAVNKAVQEKKDLQQRIIRNSIIAVLVGSLIFLIVVYRQRNKIARARKRSDELLLNILPVEVADELKINGYAEPKHFDTVTVMFTDFKGFTSISEKLSPTELVETIDICFKAFDQIVSKYNIEKIKTIGDAYMCAGGLPIANNTHATDVVSAACEIRNFMLTHEQLRKSQGKEIFEIRIGIHTGPVVAGIVGVKKFAYDIWGDTVNVAARMEQHSDAGKINISGSTYALIHDKFDCTYRGKIQAKNKGEIDMYFVT